jgi:hypothetical protein
MLKTPSQMQREIERDWMDIESLGSNTQYAETYISSTVQQKGPEELTGKTITEKCSIKDGKRKITKTEEIMKPDDTKEVTEIVTEGSDVKTNEYLLGLGQEKKAIRH